MSDSPVPATVPDRTAVVDVVRRAAVESAAGSGAAPLLLRAFGPERLLWGSDWPVLELAGSYSAWWQASRRLSANLSEAGKQALYGGTARRVYRL